MERVLLSKVKGAGRAGPLLQALCWDARYLANLYGLGPLWP